MTDRPRIVIIDDEAAIRNAIRMLLEDAGFQVIDAASWAEARRIVSDADIVILDMIMPGYTGLEAITELRDRGARTKIIGISGTRHALDAASLCGADKVLSKPFSGPMLLSTVTGLL